MIRVLSPFDFRLDGGERLGGIDIDKRGVAGHGHFHDGFHVIADQMARADIALNLHQVVEEAARPHHRIAAPAFDNGRHHQRGAPRWG